MKDICNFIPGKGYEGGLAYYHFAYESTLKRLSQPIMHSYYCLHMVAKGTALLKVKNNEYSLTAGDMFFTFPSQAFRLDGDADFGFIYISFEGDGASALLNTHGISLENSICTGYKQLLPFWLEALRRISPTNANTLTESVLMYTLSFIGSCNSEAAKGDDKFSRIIEYIDNNCSNPELSLGKVADIFFYNDKYLSALFKKKTGVKFTEYLSKARVSHALKIIKEEHHTVSELAEACGFSDALYFSKVFKRIMGAPPSSFIK